jgi:hypothetical protein
LTSHLLAIHPVAPNTPIHLPLIYLPTHLPTHPPIYSSTHSIHPPTHFIYSLLSFLTHSSAQPSIHPPFHPPNPSIIWSPSPSTYPSVSLVYPSICLTTHLCIYLSLHSWLRYFLIHPSVHCSCLHLSSGQGAFSGVFSVPGPALASLGLQGQSEMGPGQNQLLHKVESSFPNRKNPRARESKRASWWKRGRSWSWRKRRSREEKEPYCTGGGVGSQEGRPGFRSLCR